jgi:hypothetical protein
MMTMMIDHHDHRDHHDHPSFCLSTLIMRCGHRPTTAKPPPNKLRGRSPRESGGRHPDEPFYQQPLFVWKKKKHPLSLLYR